MVSAWGGQCRGLTDLFEQGPHRSGITPPLVVALGLDPWRQLCLEAVRQCVLLLADHQLKDFAQFACVIGWKVDRLGEPARESRVARDEAMHFAGIAGNDDDQAIAIIFHVFEQRFDGFPTEIAFPFGGGQAVGFIDEQNAIECGSTYVERLHGGLTDITPDQLASVGLNQMAFAKHAQRTIDIAERACHDRLSNAGRTGENHMPAGRGDGQILFPPPALDFEDSRCRPGPIPTRWDRYRSVTPYS